MSPRDRQPERAVMMFESTEVADNEIVEKKMRKRDNIKIVPVTVNGDKEMFYLARTDNDRRFTVGKGWRSERGSYFAEPTEHRTEG